MPATRFTSIWLLGMLFISANTIQTINTDPKPDQKLCLEVFPIKKAAKKAMTAAIHHGRKKPLA